jgi:hypothetical protein
MKSDALSASSRWSPLTALGKLHDALDEAEERTRPACRTLVRDGGSWSEQLELDLHVEGYQTQPAANRLCKASA